MSLPFASVSLALLAAVVPVAAWGDQSGDFTLTPDIFLNLETGAASRTGGDILWDGSALIPQGRAALFNLGKAAPRTFKAISARQASAAPYNSSPIPEGALVAGDVFGVRTNGGNYAKVVVTASGGGSLSLQYTTFGASAPTAAAAPAAIGPPLLISKFQNNYSYILPGMPNYGIAPGSLFVIFGNNLSTPAPPVLQSSAPPGLPTTLNQTSVSVKVNGVTTTPGLYYTTAGAIAAVLPSTTPVGDGTVTVTSNGQISAATPIHVVPSAVGLDTLYGTGNGAAVVTDANFNVLNPTNSATPGQTVILWGSGVGADTSNDDRTYPQNSNNVASGIQVYIGGISAKVLYGGRSQYPGLDQFDVVVPPNVSTGCFVSVVVQTGSIVSNAVTMPINATAGPCTDPATGFSGTQVQALANKAGGVNGIGLGVLQQTSSNGSVSSALLEFPAVFPSAYLGNGYEYVSQGSCTIVPPGQGTFSPAQLDLGTVQVTGPNGTVTLGGVETQLPSGSVTKNPGTYTFTGAGGANIGSFKASVNVTAPLTWTNKAALGTITRSQGATITWTGGFPGGDVQVNSGVGGPFGTVRFYCHAPSSAGQLTIPPSILMAMPAGSGALGVSNFTAPQSVTANGVDLGLVEGIVIQDSNVAFK